MSIAPLRVETAQAAQLLLLKEKGNPLELLQSSIDWIFKFRENTVHLVWLETIHTSELKAITVNDQPNIKYSSRTKMMK